MTGALGITVLLAACEPPTDPIALPQRLLLVQAVLDMGASEQRALIEWTESGTSTATTPVTNATVSIVTPEGLIVPGTQDVPSEQQGAFIPGMYRFELSGLFLRAGGTYTLSVHVETPRFRRPKIQEASGTTTIPQAELPGNVVVFSNFYRSGQLQLAWPRVPGARSYQVAIRCDFTQGEFSFGYDTYTTFADTSVTIAGTARTLDNNPVFYSGTSATVVVAAVDDNYYEYYHPTVDPFAGAPPSRLTGALGFFGSVAPVMFLRYANVRD
jgi:hypothetical protein